MQSLKHIRLIRNLMLLSQAMLLGLLVHWLSSEYRQEHERLERELSSIFRVSGEVAIDTMLFRFVVTPALAGMETTVPDTTGIMSATILADSFRIAYGNMIQSSEQGGKGARISVYTNDSARTTTISKSVMSQMARENELRVKRDNELLLRSVRMIVSSDKDSVRRPVLYWNSGDNQIDTAAFIRSIKDTLAIRASSVMVFLENEVREDSTRFTKNNYLKITGNPGSFLPTVIFRGLTSQVLVHLLWEILFGVVLLSLIAGSFTTAFRNMKAQYYNNRIRDDFIGNISHELKTPVTTMKLALEAILKGGYTGSESGLHEYIGIAVHEADRLDRLVARVLDYGRIEGGGNGFSFEFINADIPVSAALESLRSRIEAEKAHVRISTAGLIKIKADPFYLESVIVNILDNSLKYCPKPVSIDIEIRQEGSWVIIDFSDDGPGIPPEYQKRVFDRFFRIPADNRHNVKGYGLGLSFSRMVVLQHGGKISAGQSTSGGTRITIKIPLHG